jgi:hypothetical protein
MNPFIKRLLFWGGVVALVYFSRHKSYWVFLVWLFAWAIFLGLISRAIRGRRKSQKVFAKSAASTDPRINTPRKAARAAFNYFASHFLFFFNPFLLSQSFLQIVGVHWEKNYRHPVLQAEQYKQKVNYILPIAGEWRVFNGGVTQETSHSWRIPSQRFAYDLVKFGENGRSFNGNGRKLTDYFCFDAPILAPAAGVVVKARDGIHDAPFVGTFWMDCFTRNIGGNSVLIKHADGEYCFLAHLKRGSVRVKTGEIVKQGREIGRCGHSGNSSEPHLHFQFQNGTSFYFSSGLPVKFSRFYSRNGEQKDFMELGYISKNTFVAASE